MGLILDDREKDRAGDEVSTHIRRLGVEVSITRLDYGDCMFEGSGPDGPCLVGCERKKLSDLVNSMKDRRLSGRQLREMWTVFDFVFLFTEGEWRPGPNGEIEELRPVWDRDLHRNKWGWAPFYKSGNLGDRGAVSYNQLLGYLTGLELRGGVVWRRTRNSAETAAQYVALYRNFTDKAWGEHRSHDQLYCGDVPAKGHGSDWGSPHSHEMAYLKNGRGRCMVSQEPPTTVWRMAAQLPGIDNKAEVVAKHFGTVRKMAEASPEEWKAIDFGRKADGGKKPGIGAVTAAAVVRAINEPGA